MQAVFGAQYRPQTKDALVEMPMFENRKKIRFFHVVSLATSVLASGETVMVAESTYSLDNAENIEQPGVIHAYITVYFLRQTQGKWTVVKRHENIAYRGLPERPGSVLFLMLGKDKPGLATVSAVSDEGCTHHRVQLFDLRDDPLRDLTNKGISSYSSWNSGCAGNDLEPDNETKGTWFLAEPKQPSAYHDVVMTFTSATTIMSGPEEQATKSIVTKKSNARYAYDGKQYKLVSGDNPTDDIAPSGKPDGTGAGD